MYCITFFNRYISRIVLTLLAIYTIIIIMVNAINKLNLKPIENTSGVPALVAFTKLNGLFSYCRFIPLTRGKFAIVDAEDFNELSKHKWQAACSRKKWCVMKAKPTRLMHRFIIKPTKEQEIDHRNGNGLDNRKANLRICTHIQNMQNLKPRKGISSPYKGVSWKKQYKKWCVRIQLNGKSTFLGYFNNEIAAAVAYDTAAIKLLDSEFAYLNFQPFF